MTSWPLPGEHSYVDATTGATPLGMLHGHFGHIPDLISMMLGNIGGSLGEIGAFALILGGLFLIFRRIITWHIPVGMLGAVFVFTFIMGFISPETYNINQAASACAAIAALNYGLFHLFSGGLLLGAFFMATDYVTSPMTPLGQLIYAVGIGIITVLIRLFGSYPEGVSFAILIMNGVTPLINTYIKPKRFGEVKK